MPSSSPTRSPELSPDLSTELHLICLTLKVFLKTSAPDDLEQQLAETPPESAQLLQLLNIHRVLPVFYLTLKQSNLLTALPTTLQNALTEQYQQLTRRSLQLTAETLKLQQQFQQAGIRVLPLKGTLLSQQIHGSFTHRAPGDIDLLVEPGAHDAAMALLENLDYHWHLEGESWNPTQKRLFIQQQGEVTYKNAQNKISIDLHLRWARNRHFFTLPFEEAWQQAVKLSVTPSAQLPVLHPTHQLLFLSAHAAKHRWDRLAWLLDIAQLLRSTDELDVQAVCTDAQQAAQQLACDRPLAQALQLSEQWLGYSIQQQKAPSTVVQWLVEKASQEILNTQPRITAGQFNTPAITPATLWPLLQYELRLKPNFAYWQTCWSRLFFSARDWQLLALPEPLWFMYILLRPLLYIWRLQRS